MGTLPREFYARDARVVARELLGKRLVRILNGSRISARIVETEAYVGVEDKAAHFYGGLRTPRVEVIYGAPGFAYVFFVYGMHHCFNVVTGTAGSPQAALIRAAEPAEGLEAMALSRFGTSYAELGPKRRIQLTNGPAKLCRALAIDRSFNGMDLCGGRLFIEDRGGDSFSIASSARIGIDYAEEAREYPWRMYIEGNGFVSRR